MKIGIIGNGFVGKATFQLKCDDIDILVYDINPKLCIPSGTILNDLNVCEFIFVSVPTPMQTDGSCYLNIVKNVTLQLQEIDYKGFIVLRSTVPVGTSDSLNCYFMPEFLTEKNYINDFIENKDWIFGLRNIGFDNIFKEKIKVLFQLAYKNNKIKYNNIHFTPNKEAEMIKMFRNCFLATKVSFCNEIYQFCKKKNIDYEQVRLLACNDNRILHSHTQVPGHDGLYGFGGTCFPKDSGSLRYEMQKAGVEPHILNSIIYRNENIDRVEKDWEQDKGRAYVDE